MPANILEVHCEYLSASEAGDYFQVAFETSPDSQEGYLLLQRQFEMPDGGKCYIETDDMDFGGHFRVRNAHLTRNVFQCEFGTKPPRRIRVFFNATDSNYSEVKRILQIMIPRIDLA